MLRADAHQRQRLPERVPGRLPEGRVGRQPALSSKKALVTPALASTCHTCMAASPPLMMNMHGPTSPRSRVHHRGGPSRCALSKCCSSAVSSSRSRREPAPPVGRRGPREPARATAVRGPPRRIAQAGAAGRWRVRACARASEANRSSRKASSAADAPSYVQAPPGRARLKARVYLGPLMRVRCFSSSSFCSAPCIALLKATTKGSRPAPASLACALPSTAPPHGTSE